MKNREQTYKKISEISQKEFSDVVQGQKIVEKKLRLFLVDGSYIDVWFSLKRPFFSYHWERTRIDNSIYRHNNFPDRKAKGLRTFPKHFHEGNDETVKESYISDDPEEAIREFLEFARGKIEEK